MAIAAPRCSSGQISAGTPPTLLTGGEQKKPVKQRLMNMLAKLWLAPVPNAKIAPAAYGMMVASIRPLISHTGAHSSGPMP
jgi:hypothetical protein